MFPWGLLVQAGGLAISGISSAINNRKQQQAADAEAARKEAYYQAKANENPLARSENQYLLGQYDREAQQQIENARGIAAITGATPEYSLGVQKAVAEGKANLMGQMSAGASARKDRYDELAEQTRHKKALDDQARLAARQQTYANLASNAVSAAGSIMDSYGARSPKIKNNDAIIKEGNAAVAQMNAEAATKGLQVQDAPTSISQQAQKVNTALAAVKSNLAEQDAQAASNYATWMAEQQAKKHLPKIKTL